MSDYLLTGAVSNAVNVPSVTAAEAPILKPYMKLAELLGSFCGQMVDGPVDAVSLELEGHAASLNAEPIKAAALAGLLRPQVDSVNMVNAPWMAGQPGVEVSVTRPDREPDYPPLVRTTLRSDGPSRGLAGHLPSGTTPPTGAGPR